MPRSGNPLFPVVNLMLVPFGLIALLLGSVVLIAGEGGEVGWIFALLAASGAMMLGGAVWNLVKWRRWVRQESAAAAAMARAARAHADPALPVPAPVMAHWTYEPGEWSAYAAGEVRHRGAEAVGVLTGVVLLGTVVLWQENGSWALSFAVALSIGAMVGGGMWLIARAAHRGNVATPRGEVVITPGAILVNGRYEVLQDHHFSFRGARILENEHPPILELRVEWPTRSGPAGTTYRIPIPAGRMDEARAVARELEAGYALLNAR